MQRVRSLRCETSDRHAVKRKRHNPLLRKRNRRNRLNRSVTQRTPNANNDALSRSNDASSLSSDEQSVRPVQLRLNVRRDRCDNNSHKANASQHQLDRSNSSNDA